MTSYPLSKTYDFNEVEPRLYEWWEASGFFTPKIDPDTRPYVISMPPPNVTGELHLGHVMFVSLEDMMIRHSRMTGRPTLWLPGTDHAGIATQLQVEKFILRTDEVTREELGREAFLERTWAWKEKYGGEITEQLRRLGASCDWSRERFTLDEGLSRAVREAFVTLYQKGLIYRGSYLINWSPGLKTAVSDLEVEYQEEQGTLYYFKYPIEDSEEVIPVATTRPETILGDTAVAVHPEDERYKSFIGRTCLVPILDRRIPIIADEYVDREFGTGALKITPGHDPADYAIGEKHQLPIVNIFNPDASMNDAAGPYAGMDRFECRERLWADMKVAGLTLREEPYTMQIPRSQRGGEIIEPMISTQWFVRMETLAEPALQAVQDGHIKIVPERFTKVYFNWLENIRDWCISRQLWWGHRIPAWHCSACGEITVEREDPTQCGHCGSKSIEQDPDVLDTWFSSGLWPFSTLGWPEKTPDLDYFYPTTMMETGYDILFFWVARMIMMGLEFTGQIPFEIIYLHGLVRVEKGTKMSKSLGNVVDPLQFIEEYGADALRFTLLTGSTPGQDTRIEPERIEANRNFANKLWNIGRMILGSLDSIPGEVNGRPEPTLPDRWVQLRLNEVVEDVERLFKGHQYGEAGRQIYEFVWTEFADWYLEIAKLQLAEGGPRAWATAEILIKTFEACLRLLHPFMPFVTEELWGHIRGACIHHSAHFEPIAGEWGDALIVAPWPQPDPILEPDTRVFEIFATMQQIITAIRNVRAEKSVDPRRMIAAHISAGEYMIDFQALSPVLYTLAGIDPTQLVIESALESLPAGAVSLVVRGIDIYLPMAGMLDLGAERKRLSAELEEARGQIDRLKALLEGSFAQRAPGPVVEKERERLRAFQATVGKLKIQLDSLQED